MNTVVSTTRTYSDIRNAVNQVAALGGGTVTLENVDYVDDGSGTILIPSDNIHIQGVGGTRIVGPPNGAINIFSSNVSYKSPVHLTQNVAVNDNVLYLNNVAEFRKGGFVRIGKVQDTIVQWDQISYVRAVNSDSIRITPMIPYTINMTDNYSISPIELTKGISIRNITFEGQNNSDGTHAIMMLGLYNASFKDLTFSNFIGAAAFVIELGFANVVDTAYLDNCGSMTECDFKLSYQTNATLNGLRSVSASGFGPQYIRCNFCTSTNINILSAAGRGLKLMATLNCLFTNVFSHDNASVGIAICYGTQRNQFVNCSAIHHVDYPNSNNEGFWTTGDANISNMVVASTFFDNQTADIFLDPRDHHNVVVDCEYDTTYVGCCACNFTNKIYESIEKCWFIRMWENCFGCCCSNKGCGCCDDC